MIYILLSSTPQVEYIFFNLTIEKFGAFIDIKSFIQMLYILFELSSILRVIYILFELN